MLSIPSFLVGSDGLTGRTLPTVPAASARTVAVDEVIEHLSELEYGPAAVRQVEGAYLALMVAGSIAVVSVAIYAYLASLAGGESLIKSEERWIKITCRANLGFFPLSVTHTRHFQTNDRLPNVEIFPQFFLY